MTMKRIGRIQLQIIAIVSMFIDHFGAVIVRTLYEKSGDIYEGSWLEFIIRLVLGRLALPLFIFLLVEGIYHSKNILKYLLRILLLGVISTVPHSLYFHGVLWNKNSDLNILFTLFLAGINIYIFVKYKHIVLSIISTICICAISYAIASEYAVSLILIALVFYIFRYNERLFITSSGIALIVGALLVTPLYYLRHYGFDACINNGVLTLDLFIRGAECEIASLLALIFIYYYDGNKNKGKGLPKTITYSFYPLHLVLLYLISLFL